MKRKLTKIGATIGIIGLLVIISPLILLWGTFVIAGEMTEKIISKVDNAIGGLDQVRTGE